LDKGYVDPPRNTPDLRRITPKKKSRSDDERRNNIHIFELRVHVESFFGKAYKIWGLLRHAYFLDHISFDIDIDNCLLLTNEHIQFVDELTEEDRQFYRGYVDLRKIKTKARQRKRKESTNRYKRRRTRIRRSLASPLEDITNIY